MYLERSIPTIYRGKKVVIAGDHKQLRPCALGVSKMAYREDENDVDDMVDVALEQESLLDLARFRYTNHVLNFHYRAQYEELIAFSNSTFYYNELFVSPNVRVPEEPPIEYHNVHGIWNNQCNEEEAEYIVQWLKDTLRNRKDKETIGIVTFNSKQRDHIFDVIDRESLNDPEFGKSVQDEFSRKDNGEDTGLFIKNIENVQGDERDIIVFSIGYAKDKSGKFYRRFGVLNQVGGENRINVAVSRAKKKIHVVASIDPSEFEVGDVKNNGPKVLRAYLHYAKAVSDRDEELVRKVLVQSTEHACYKPQEAIDELAAFLRKKGYAVKTNVGISTYNIDMAVFDSNGYIIGIEADSSIYPEMSSTRARDVHRTRYLKGRGWTICRYWVSEYWRNKEAEFERIASCVQDAVSKAE